MKGKVYLVGAGPGDPGLITVKGKECIEASDVVVYDYLASPVLLEYARNAEMINVGKKRGVHIMPQDRINALLIEKANCGAIVTRLKGGDPFIFGRGGEEVEALIKAGIPFEVVCGVTSAIAAPAYAGIPLTHRKCTSSLAFVAGHENPDKQTSNINWQAIAKGIDTVVFLMGVKNLSHIIKNLLDNGKPPETPVALVRWGTTARQVTITGTLATIVEKVKTAGLKSPAVIVVGDVVNFTSSMNWFENQPLKGKRIVITRAREQASDLVKCLSGLGAECVECPTIRVDPPESWEPMDASISRLSEFDWLVFTSVNGVNFFFDRLFLSGRDTRALGHLHTASVGPATSKRLFEFGIKSDIIPESYRAESIVEAFGKQDIKGEKILLPQADKARPVLPLELKKMGALVEVVTAYHTTAVCDHSDFLLSQLEEGEVDVVTFTSSSTAKNFIALLPPEKAASLMKDVIVASIGPITSDTAKALGFDVHITAEPSTVQGLCEAILQYYQKSSPSN